ncbi:cellulose binding domain-containing protein [Mucilaginibacter sp. cycad4]|uniref:cellulose binding domain-containing protein n=1 Tax=Mucilaginibacter sp. cycad4 TaxID=3342096 RepID=UPI002AABD771|nr:cellulose binding domain-containing protein [Mucilaginibacter gossypii]WPV02132.1 cellulose binding domain-containing protein [Mucilaginibacter gossypii]
MRSEPLPCSFVITQSATHRYDYRNSAIFKYGTMLLLALLFLTQYRAHGQTFVHPGGLHSQSDLDRMKTKVAAGAHPWIDSWNLLIADSRAQNNYAASPQSNMGVNRVRAQQDASAAYLCALRWYISGDTTYAACAVRNLNAWSSRVNQVPTGADIPGLIGIPIFNFGLAAEILRMYPGWSKPDFDQFKSMMTTYLYPVVNDFLTNHRGTCDSHYAANWDACSIGAVMTMGVLCDDTAKFNQGVNYFKYGNGNGSIKNAVYYVHPGNLGQWQESGRDQGHALLGVGFLAYVAQVAWNQGVDLFGYDNNRLLAGAEYVAKTNLWEDVPFKPYNNCDNNNHFYIAENGRGAIGNRPFFELLYNHYNVSNGLDAPSVKAMAQLLRPEGGDQDHLGYGTLTFTLDATTSPYPASPVPPVPANVKATAGVSRITLDWNTSSGNTAQGYNVLRSTSSGGPYTSVASWTGNTTPQYIDVNVVNGQTYYYVVQAVNQAGTSANSTEVNAKPAAAGSLPSGWAMKDIGTVSTAGTAGYANVSNNTYVLSGSGTGIGGTADSFSFTYSKASGDVTIISRLISIAGTLGKTGIMIRESLDPQAKAFLMKLGDTGWRIAGCGSRSTTGGNMSYTDGDQFTWTPFWLKIQRAGNVFTASQSLDGTTWFTVATSTIAMSDTFYIGMETCSGSSTGAVNNSVFDNVSIIGGGNAPIAPASLIANGVGSTQIKVTWNATPGAAAYNIKRSTTSGGPYLSIATGVTDTTYLDTKLSWSTNYYYVVTAANVAGESANTAEANAMTQAPGIPPAPAGISVVPGDGNVVLTWNSSTDATTYSVKRSVQTSGPYTIIGSTTTTNYKDSTTVNGTVYFYVVSATNVTGESVNSAEVSAKPAVGPFSYYAFDSTSGTTAIDSWNNRNGTLSSGATWVTGAINNGVRLDGSANGYVTLPTGIVSTLNDFTISTWLKLDATANWARLFDFGSGTTSYMYLSPKNGNNGFLRYAINTGSGEQQLNSSAVIPTGTWVHLAVTQSGNTSILYVNGTEVGRNTGMTLKPASLGNSTQNWIGRSQFTSDPKLAGTVDDFRIYARALTATEITALVNALAPPAPASLTASGSNKVSLNWAASNSATSYSIKKSTVNGSAYTTIATGITQTNYVDSLTTSGGPYYYVVTATKGLFESAPSPQASIVLTPAIPNNVIATSWNGRIDLSWNPANGATNYNISRVDDDTYTPIATVSSLNYSVTGLDNGEPFSYVITATNNAGTSGYSAPGTATPVSTPVVNNWLHTDVGTVVQSGNAGYSGGISIYGSGADIWGNADAFHYTYQSLSGDGAIVARVATIQNYLSSTAISGNAKAGVMIRESLAANSKHAMVDVTPTVGIEFLRRASTNGTSASTGVTGTFPNWVKLVRSGSTLSAYSAIDGITWQPIGSQSISMASNIYIGLITCSHNSAVVSLSKFDTVSIASSLPQITSKRTASGVYNTVFADTIKSTNATYHYSASGLPTGLNMNAGNGIIAGSPSVSGSFSVVLRAYNALGTTTDTLLITISKKNQDIIFASLMEKKIGDPDIDPGATSSSGLPVSYNSSDSTVASIINGKIHINGAGSVNITALQPGNNNYNPAIPVNQNLIIQKLDQTVSFAEIGTKVIGDQAFDPGATASSGLPVTYTSSDTTVAIIVNGMVNIKAAGITQVAASQAGNGTYNSTSLTKVLTVIKKTQTIAFSAIGSKRPGDADFAVTATASSGLPVSFGSSNGNVATVSNGLVHINGTGTTIITASQPGNAIYKDTTISQTLTVVPYNLQVQYKDGDNGQLVNTIARPFVKIANADSVGVAYSELTMRYWFTAENYAGINTWIDYAQLGNSNVKLKYVQLAQPRSGALGYIEYSFAVTGSLAANASTGEIQSRFANQDWSNLNEADDYSYENNTSYAANNHITLYRNGMLIWGTEPAVTSAVTSLNVAYQNQNQAGTGNTISTYLAINNTGNTPVAFGDITARYWFTEEGTQSLNYWIDYAKKGTGNISGSFVKVDPVRTGADTYFEIAVNPAAGMLYPLSTSGNIQYRIAKSDWSNFNESDDYSYMAKDIMKENNHITIYYQGQLIYGTEPSASGLMSLKSASLATVPQKSEISSEGIVVHQGLSPNGDGINDVLIIEGLTAYPENKLVIMDRNGAKVYETQGYDNSSKVFDGHSSLNGNMQQPGTYFYSLDYKTSEGNKHKTGFIIIKY